VVSREEERAKRCEAAREAAVLRVAKDLKSETVKASIFLTETTNIPSIKDNVTQIVTGTGSWWTRHAGQRLQQWTAE
jgi:hypothetical protein